MRIRSFSPSWKLNTTKGTTVFGVYYILRVVKYFQRKGTKQTMRTENMVSRTNKRMKLSYDIEHKHNEAKKAFYKH